MLANSRRNAIQTARAILAARPLYLDTETTGLHRDDEIIEIAILDDENQIVFEALVRPSRPVPRDTSSVHGIYDQDLVAARTWPVIWPQVRSALFGKTTVIYNEEFDMRMMQQTHSAYRLPWKERFQTMDLLKLYAEFRGEWDPRRRGYRYHSLENAGQHCGIELPNAHRAAADTRLTRALLHYIAGCQE